MMRRAVFIALVLLTVLVVVLAVGCSSPAPGTGYVLERRFDPGHMEGAVRSRPGGMRCTSDSKGRTSCTPDIVTYWEPNDHWVPDRWQLKLENCYSQEGCRADWVTVSEETFTRFEVGSHYPEPR